MAVVQNIDVYDPQLFARLVQERQTERNIFVRSGVVLPNSIMQSQVVQGGRNIELVNFNPLTLSEPNDSNDNPAIFSVPKKIDTAVQRAKALVKNDSWSAMDLASQISLNPTGAGDPLQAITNRLGDNWTNYEQKVVLNSLQGVMLDNIANDAGDMVVTVGTDAVGLPTVAEMFSLDNFVRAKQTMGDAQGVLTQITVHSAIYSRMVTQNQVITVPASQTSPRVDFYNGLEVLVDDQTTVTVGVNRLMYTCILSGRGLFGSAMGYNPKPFEMIRIPGAGNGGGQEVIWSRINEYIHPLGLDFTSNTIAGQSATWAELALAVNWNRKWNRKNIPLAYLRVNN